MASPVGGDGHGSSGADTPQGSFPHLFSPLRVGTMDLRNRVMAPPHASAIGNLWGSSEEADRNIAYWRSLADAGVAWIDGVTGHVRNNYITGFEPSGPSAETLGFFRLPFYIERVKRFGETMREAGAVATAQLTMIGGLPNAPSDRRSSPVVNSATHVMTREEIARFLAEYAWSAEQARRAGLDGLELHMNHDDLLEWFLSPLTNAREDEYGGNLENRARFIVEILTGIREVVGDGMTLGVRMNLRQEQPGGLTAEDGIETARHLEATGLIDFLHVVVGTPWGNPSYIQPHAYRPAQWAKLAGALRAAVSLPVVHSGLINGPEVAERVLADGNADVVGIARAHIADQELLVKARDGRLDEIRPCVGGNDCISRRYVENLPFGCAVNPHTGKDPDARLSRTSSPKRVLVVGGGPAGMEFAALAREKGHRVALWEGADRLGGQLRIAVAAPTYGPFGRYLEWQERRLSRLGVEVSTGHMASSADVIEAGADVVAVATGARSRVPVGITVDQRFVFDVRDVLTSAPDLGKRVVVIAEDDHMPPLSVADFLAERGHEVTIVYGTQGPAQLLGRYAVGGILARLDEKDVRLRLMEQVVRATPGKVATRNVYSGRERTISGVDSVVLACGGVAEAGLYEELRTRHPAVHLFGDAYAPRRLVFATRQAYALCQLV